MRRELTERTNRELKCSTPTRPPTLTPTLNPDVTYEYDILGKPAASKVKLDYVGCLSLPSGRDHLLTEHLKEPPRLIILGLTEAGEKRRVEKSREEKKRKQQDLLKRNQTE